VEIADGQKVKGLAPPSCMTDPQRCLAAGGVVDELDREIAACESELNDP
jgi:hypothetical protein